MRVLASNARDIDQPTPADDYPTVHGLPKQSSPGVANVFVSAKAFRIVWTIVIAYHLFNGIFIIGVGAVQILMSLPAVYGNVWLINIPRIILSLGGWGFLTVGVLHILIVFQHLAQSLCRRRLSFGHDASRSSGYEIESNKETSLLWRPVEIWGKYFGIYGNFGVHGKRFYVSFYNRQFVVILLQTFQAFQLSESMTRKLINQSAVGVIVTNCLYGTLIDKALWNQPVARRVTCLVIDLLLDFIVAVLIPIIVCVPHVLEFDWKAFVFPDSLIYNEVWLTNATTEAKQVLVSSIADFISSIALHLSGLIGLDTLKTILHRLDSSYVNQVKEDVNSKSVKPSGIPLMKKSSSNLFVRSNLIEDAWERKVRRAFRFFGLVWAIFVLTAHFTAQKLPGHLCRLRVNAWFATNESCSIVNVNCHRIGSSGEREDIAAALMKFQRKTLTKLVVSHCPQLQVPTIITEFHSLLGFEAFNCTIIDWPRSAALTATTNPSVAQIQLLATNLTVFPDALLSPDKPRNFNAILLYETNLTSLPAAIGSYWSSSVWPSLRIEHSSLTALPPSFKDVSVLRLSLVGNAITELDDEIFAKQSFASLQLSQNPLTALPSSIGDTSNLERLLFQDTNVSTAPAWLQKWMATTANPVVSFTGSPLCSSGSTFATTSACDSSGVQKADEFRFDLVVKARPV